MSVPSQLGIFGWAKAANSDDVVTSDNTHGANWWRHKATEISFGGIQDLRTFPPEVGGELTPTGAYKNGLYVGGGVTVQPRIQEVIGHLIKSMMGAEAPSFAGTISAANVVLGVAGNLDATGDLPLVGGGPVVLGTASVLTLAITDIDAGAAVPQVQITGTSDGATVISEQRNLFNGTVITHQAFKTVTKVHVSVVTTPDIATLAKLVVGSYTAAPYIHLFTMAANQSSLEWLNLRKWIPTSGSGFGETMIGAKITGVRLTIPASGIVTARIEFQGRRVVYANAPGWDSDLGFWDPTTGAYEDTTSVPLASAVNGAVQLPIGTPAKVTSLIINWANNVTTPEQERIVGSPYPDDVMALSRAMSIQATVKWNDADLFSQIYTGQLAAGAGGGWVAKPFASDFLAQVLAPNDIPGASAGTKYQLDVAADNVMWNCNGPITLAGADLVQMPIIGTVIKANASNPYATFKLYNARSAAY